MNITKTNIDELNAVIKIQIVKEDYEKKVNDVLKDYRKKASIDGFRPGKVPMGMIKKMYGTAVLVDEINKMLSKELMEYINKNELKIIGEPLPNEEDTKEINWEKDTEFEFAFDIALVPEYTLNISKRDKMNYYNIKVSEEMIDNGVEVHARRFGSQKPVEAVENNEVLLGNFAQLDAEGNYMEDGITADNVTISLEYIKDEESKKMFVGAKVNDVITFNPTKAFGNATEVSAMLKITKEEAEALDANFQYTINEITTFVKAELNTELFDKVFEAGQIKTIEEFRARIEADIKEQLKRDSDYKFQIDAKEKFVKKSKMKLPEAFLKRWLVAVNEKLTAEQIEKDFANYEIEFKWQLIKSRIMQENDLKIERQDLLEFAKQQAIMQFQQYGMMSIPDEYLNSYAEKMLENADEVRRMDDLVADQKVSQFIREAVKVEENEVAVEEFNKLFE